MSRVSTAGHRLLILTYDRTNGYPRQTGCEQHPLVHRPG